MIMIYYINARNIPENAKEVWFVVRSLQPYKPLDGVKYKHVAALSPNLNLFFWARKLIDNNVWDKDSYAIYKEKLTKQILNDPIAKNIIDYLKTIKESKDKDIYLACYCQNFERCHLKILKDIIKETIDS